MTKKKVPEKKIDVSNLQHRTVRQLAYHIKDALKTKEPVERPRFALFLGAGASVESGVKAINGMLIDFKRKIFDCECPFEVKAEKEKEAWLNGQDWYKAKGNLYGKLFERAYPKERDRQLYIEHLIDGRKPSFGYVVLSNLIARNYINTIVTTNFDDLVYNACTTFSEMRPVVYAYGGFASELQLTAPSPKVLKLHGDYLFNALKNTDPELSSQDPNMARQVRTILSEYGLIVIGYNGTDESIMEILSDMPKENALYWCHYTKGEPLSESAKKLIAEKEGFVVEIDGFNDMMNQIREIIGFDANKMIEPIEGRRRLIIEEIAKFDKYSTEILEDAAEVLEKEVQRPTEAMHDLSHALYYFSKALAAQQRNKFEEAEINYRRVIELDQNFTMAYINLGNLLFEQNKPQEAETNYRKVIELDQNFAMAYNNLGVLLSKEGKNKEAEKLLQKAIELDSNYIFPIVSLAAVYKRRGNKEKFDEYISKARERVKPDDFYALACLEALCDNTDTAIKNLQHAVQIEADYRLRARVDPDFESLRDDPRFKELVGGVKAVR